MRTLLEFEIKRFIKNKVNWLFIGLLFLGLTILFVLQVKDESTFMGELADKYAKNKSYSQSITVSYGKMIDKEILMGDHTLDEMVVIRDFYDQQTRDEQSLALFYRKDQPKDYAYLNIVKNKLFTRILQGLEAGISNESTLKLRGYEPNQLKLEIDYTQYLIDHEIEPIHNIYKVDGANGLKQFFSFKYMVFILIIVVFVMVELFAKELMEGSYKLYQTLPYNRKALFLSRGFFAFLIAISIFVLSTGFYFILCTVKGGIGDFTYPIMSRSSLFTFTSSGMEAGLLILPVWQYVLCGMALFMILGFFTVALVYFVSLMLDSQNKTLGVMIGVILFAFIANSFLDKEIVFNYWYPYAYIFIDKVLQVQNRSNLLTGLLLNLSGLILILVMSFKRYMKKDFLGAND